jgi:hypothetical protein
MTDLDFSVVEFANGRATKAGLAANFHAADEITQKVIRELVLEYGELTKELTQLLCPVDTGFMQSSVRADYSNNGLTFDVGWRAEDFFDVGENFYPIYPEFGIGQAPQPSLQPAWAETSVEFQAAVSRELSAAYARRFGR